MGNVAQKAQAYVQNYVKTTLTALLNANVNDPVLVEKAVAVHRGTALFDITYTIGMVLALVEMVSGEFKSKRAMRVTSSVQ
jgi:hypothetical protein